MLPTVTIPLILTLIASISYALTSVIFGNNTSFLINIVTENEVNDENSDILPPSSVFDRNTWTVFLATNLNFGFDKDTIDSDDFVPSLSEGYYRFNFRHAELCVVFVLLTNTLNGTLTAIQNSGYGTSEYALFLIQILDLNNEIATGFQNGLQNAGNISIEQRFRASLAFVIPEYPKKNSWLHIAGVYCYSCPPEIGKIQLITGMTKNTATVASVITLSKIWNKNGHGHTAIFFSSAGLETLTRMWKYESCSMSLGQHAFYGNLSECVNGDLIAVRLISRNLNLTFALQGFNDGVYDYNWRLILRPSSVIQMRKEITCAIYRSKVGSTYQKSFKLIYCNYVENALRKNWNIYFAVFDWNVWLCYCIVLIIYGILIYKSLALALDLIWPFLGMGLWFKHPKSFVAGYLLGILGICSTYSAGVSTDFLFVDISDTVADFIKNSYKFYVTEHKSFNYIVGAAADYQVEGIRRLTGFKKATDIMYPDTNYTFPLNVSSRLDAMVTKKILMLSGEANMGLFTSLAEILELYDKVVVDSDYVCGTLELPDYVYFSYKGDFTTYGIHSQQFYEKLRNFMETGFSKQTLALINHQNVLEGHMKWSEAKKILGEPKALGLASPFGNACITQFGLIFLFGIIFILQQVYYNHACRRSLNKKVFKIVSNNSGHKSSESKVKQHSIFRRTTRQHETAKSSPIVELKPEFSLIV